jgi:hypothetical protein
MKIKAFLFLFLTFANGFLNAQKGVGITIRPIYGIGISRIKIFGFDKLTLVDKPLKLLYDTEKPKYPYWGKRYGAEIEIKINQKISVGGGFVQSFRSTKTSVFYHIKGIDDSALNPYYGGSLLKFDYRSTEFPLFFKYKVSRKRFSKYFQVSIIGDLYQYFETIQYSKDKETNILRESTITTWYHVKHGLLKIGVSPSFGVNYKINRFLNVNCDLAYAFYFNSFRIKKCPSCPIFVGGTIQTLIPNLGIGFTL